MDLKRHRGPAVRALAATSSPASAMGTVTVRAVTVPVVVDYLLSHLGLFAVIPVLPLLVTRLDRGAGAVFVGSALLVFSLSVRGGSLLISGLLHRTSVRTTMSGGLALTGAMFALLATSPGRIGTVAGLTVAGLGISSNGLSVRAYVVMSVDDPVTRNSIFSLIQIVVNMSAAVGPVAATFLISSGRDVLLLLLVALLYGVAAGFVAVTVPGDLRPRDGDVREPLRLGLLSVLVRDPLIRRVSVVTVVGSFLYGQFFSAFALQVAGEFPSPGLMAGFFTANAVLVVLLQIPVTRRVNAGLAAGVPPLRYLLIGVAAFALSCGVFGFFGAAVAGVLVGVFVFSLAETCFTPVVNTAYADVSRDRPVVEAFNLRQVAVSVGEGLGSFSGGAVFQEAANRGQGTLYWAVLAAGGLSVAAGFLRAGSGAGDGPGQRSRRNR